MGPLVPDVISNELSLIIALLIGIGFGFILESAGFSSAKKLVGLFYGYDFTVLRVFFTAGVTAMVGIVVMNHFHLIDMSIIYINPLFLWSAIIGGLIMGLGFVIGGYCPGTSICAAAIGKKDGMFFILGAAIGILIFIEGYPLFEGIYKAAYLGMPQLSDTFGIPNSIFTFVFILIAIGAFTIATKFENKRNSYRVCYTSNKYLIALASMALFFGFTQLFTPSHAEHIEEIDSIDNFDSYSFNEITSDELAIRMMQNDNSLKFIDIRSEEEFKKFALPNAVNGNYRNFIHKSWEKVFNEKGKLVIIYSEAETDEKKAALVAEDLGFENSYILKGGLNEFRKDILEFNMPDNPIDPKMKDTYRFRTSAAKQLPRIIEDAKPKVIKKKEVKRVLGGC